VEVKHYSEQNILT